ncbi:DUF4198 domain-containing protein [Rhodopirellula europaea]|uniref:ABC-type Co2+ transport system periplasmic component-like protein n=1 Tax=Rhodopirellula europaea SH398 TaxID=1263868 RepID=M5RZ19_9BACT|nr:DUF4198 domain-containing protein [Rhodopirellula europaea]EMI24545.1 ABC-type Co2+ transport system periplasmic component-like protein [Rhodopirellula europaea SH398]
MNTTFRNLTFALALLLPTMASAHDTWIQTNSPIVRTGEVVHIDLRLGNHGNHHRDFKLAGLLTLDWTSMEHIGPDEKRSDLKPQLFTSASAEKQGYWTTPVTLTQPGVHQFVQKLDRVMNHGKSIRSIRTAKSFVLASDSLDAPKIDGHTHETPAGLPFEIVLNTCPFSEVAAGQPITVTVLHHGKPIQDAVVSFIPEGETLQGDRDPNYEFATDASGQATFVPKMATRHLIAAHHTAIDEKSDEFDFTSYATTIVLPVPNQPVAVLDR